MNSLDYLSRNTKTVREIISSAKNKKDVNVAHAPLDRMINTTRIFYKTREDYRKNFPAQDDLGGKVKLVIERFR